MHAAYSAHLTHLHSNDKYKAWGGRRILFGNLDIYSPFTNIPPNFYLRKNL